MTPVILTLSRFPDIFERLLLSLETHEPYLDLVLVQDGDDSGFLEFRDSRDMAILYGEEPFVYARNANLGLKRRQYAERDVLLLNDDCELVMPILDTLQRLCEENPSIGLLSPQIDGGVGNRLQHIDGSEAQWIESTERLAFVCVYIPAKTRKLVGLLDECYHGYGAEDVAYCRRVQSAGLKLAVTPLVKVVHGYGPNGMSTSFDRVMGRAARDKSMAEMLALERKLRT